MAAELKSSEDFYLELLPRFSVIPDDECCALSMPAEEVVAEAEQLAVVAQQDRDALLGAGINASYIDTLDTRAGAFAYAAAQHEISISGEVKTKKNWKEKSPLGYELRKTLLHILSFAFRKYQDLMRSIDEIKAGKGNKDMILDLLALYILGKSNPQPLQQINFNFDLLQQAKAMHDELSDILARATLDQGIISEKRRIRDKAFTFLNEAMDEIREYGQFVFVGNPDRYSLYQSSFRQKIGSLSGSVKKETEPINA
jgi:hypothetical protein